MRAALYARVSTKDKGQDTENQLRQLREFAKHQGWELTTEYVDRTSGMRADRPKFLAMMDAASKRQFDVLLFWALDRFTREGALPTLRYLEQLSGWGVKYRSYTEAYLDTLGPFGDAIVALLAAIAKQERQRISERVLAGLARARAQGRVGGRRAVLDSKQIAKAKALKAKGESLRAIGAALGVSHETVRAALCA